jgi:hypothetical protein
VQNNAERYFNNGKLLVLPKKLQPKHVVLHEIAQRFTPGISYSEKEVNTILSDIFGDYPLLRRSLVDFHYLERTDDCSKYWVP